MACITAKPFSVCFGLRRLGQAAPSKGELHNGLHCVDCRRPHCGLAAEQIAGREHGLLTNLVVGVIGALVGGFVFGSILGFRYDEGLNLAA
jgi:hypothetical protein